MYTLVTIERVIVPQPGVLAQPWTFGFAECMLRHLNCQTQKPVSYEDQFNHWVDVCDGRCTKCSVRKCGSMQAREE